MCLAEDSKNECRILLICTKQTIIIKNLLNVINLIIFFITGMETASIQIRGKYAKVLQNAKDEEILFLITNILSW